MFPSFFTYFGDYEAIFSNTDSVDRTITSNNVPINNSGTTKYVYFSGIGSTTDITITIVDENDEYLYNYIVEAYSYDLPTDTYTLIQSETTNALGKVLMKLDVTTGQYMFKVKNTFGILVYTEPKQTLTETSYTFRCILSSIPPSVYLKLTSELPYHFETEQRTLNFTLGWDDSVTLLIDSINLTIVRVNGSGNNTVIYSAVSTADSGILYGNASGSGNWMGYVYVVSSSDGKTYLLESKALEYRDEYDMFGHETLLMCLLFIGTMTFIGLALSPEASLIFTLFGMIIFYWIGFIFISLSGLVSLVIAGLIILLRLKRY
jgi:hypothetical protein